MTVTRRHLFRLGPAVLAAAVLPRKVFGAPQDAGDGAPAMSKTRFQPLVGTSFTVNSSPTETSWLTLASIDETPAASNPGTPASRKPSPKTETFALKFYGTGAPLAQGTYSLEHFSVGQIRLFIVPSGSSTYTAVINNLVDPLPAAYPIPRKVTRPSAAAAAA